jgi:hypothetical protein
MKNKLDPDSVRARSDYVFTPVITTVAFPLLLFGRGKKTGAPQENQPKPTRKKKPKGLAVAKYELTENSVKFFATKGFPKKRWVMLKEIPFAEITNVESFGNELSLTWNSAVYEFVLKKSESFNGLRDHLLGILDGQKHEAQDNTEAVELRKSELSRVVNGSIDIVDLSFDILMGLHAKRVDWVRLEKCAARLGDSWSFSGQTLAPLNLDFTGISATIKKQTSKDTSKEAYGILRQVYVYFDGLKPDDGQKENVLNIENAKAAVQAYYMLNDALFGKIVGDADSAKEMAALGNTLMRLAGASKVKVDADELRVAVEWLGLSADGETAAKDARAIFRNQLKNL